MNATTKTARPVDDRVDPDLQTDANIRVGRTVALLDLNLPGWRDAIDLSHLDISVCQDCVVGQIADLAGLDNGYVPTDGDILYVPFGDRVARLVNTMGGDTSGGDDLPGLYGFDFWEGVDDEECYDALQVAWANAIEAAG